MRFRPEHTALVVQGGGMRGVYSMGALQALEEAGLTHTFPDVLGASAGALNGAFFLAGQSRRAVRVYTEDLARREFVSILRLQRIVDIDFLVDDVLRANGIPDLDRVRASRSTLHVVLTDAESGEPWVVTNHTPGLDFYEVMRATAALPILYGRTVDVAGRKTIDGGVADGIPLEAAIRTGCETVLVILTRPPTHRRLRPGPLMRLVIRSWGGSLSPSVLERLTSDDERFNRAMAELDGSASRGPGPALITVYPSDPDRLVSRTTKSSARLIDCADMGRKDMWRILDTSAHR